MKKFRDRSGAQHYDGKKPEKWFGKKVYDCSGLVRRSLIELGYLPETPDIGAHNFFHQLCIPVQKSKLQPGDLLFDDDAGTIVHVGVYIGNGEVVHARGTEWGVVRETMTGRFNFFGRLPFELEEQEFHSASEAIDFLFLWKEIDSPDYWKKAVEVVKYLDSVFIRWAAAVHNSNMAG